MSLVTRCPACTTTFKVVRDQLRISDGWVRCGRCSHVFDATLDLQDAPDGAVSAPATPAPAPAPSPMASMAALVASFDDARIDLTAVRPTV
ncbi:zinc-ribbon domain-containing protein, partial [Variovorax sp. YR752]|uniref:zinc-ribbon domain-containing protein n=1 Tax=Variovorax sp. YR752 TaxID=1884383 RepID=UPI003137DAC5